MVNAIDFAVRDSANRLQTGSVAGEGQGNFIRMGAGDAVSLNLGQASIVAYEQQGRDLLIKLTDGRTILLNGYFDGTPEGSLYLSTNGEIVEVTVADSGDGVLSANYGAVESWGKWSPLDDLRFTNGDAVGAYAIAAEDPAGMGAFLPGLLGGAGGLGAAAAVAGGAAVIGGLSGGGGDDDGDGAETPVEPVDAGTETGGETGGGVGGDAGGETGGEGLGGTGGTTGGEVGGSADGEAGGGTGGETGEVTPPVVVVPPPVVDTPTPPVVITPPVRAVPTVDAQTAAPLTSNTVNPQINVTGTGEPGDTVVVTVGSQSQTATITTTGTWSTTFPSTGLPGDGSYTAAVTVTQPSGTSTVLTGPAFLIDMTPPAVTVTTGTQSAGDVENLVDYTDGVTITGQGEPGASIAVQIGTATQTTTVSSTGTWSVNFTQTEIVGGEYQTGVRITATDALGNRTVLNDTLVVDTVPNPITVNSVTTDNIVNMTESQGALIVTGTSTAGAVMQVTLQGLTQTVTVGGNGTWTATYPAGVLPGGEYPTQLTATTVDANGNSSTSTHDFRVDTLVRNFATTSGRIGGDGVVNAAEAAAGITLTGTVEQGATVVVRLSNGAQQTVAANADGTWSATFAPASIPRGELSQTATITATDAVGNTSTMASTFQIDTVAPGAPEVVSFGKDASGLRDIGTVATTDTYGFTRIDASGTSSPVQATRTEDTLYGESNFRFASTVPDGSYLVINTEDTAGNESSTLLIVNTTSAPQVDLSRAGLSAFDFTAIDLTFAPDADLSITEAQLRSLTGPDGQLQVKGDTDDHVNLVGGVDSGQVQNIEGQAYKLYTLGTGASVLIDDDIMTTITPVV